MLRKIYSWRYAITFSLFFPLSSFTGLAVKSDRLTHNIQKIYGFIGIIRIKEYLFRVNKSYPKVLAYHTELYFLIYLWLSYLGACFMFGTTCGSRGCPLHSWWSRLYPNPKTMSSFERLILSWVVSFQIITGAMLRQLQMASAADFFFSTFINFFANFFLEWGVPFLLAFYTCKASKLLINEYEMSVSNYFVMRNYVRKDIQYRVRSVIYHKKKNDNQNASICSDLRSDELSDELFEKLKFVEWCEHLCENHFFQYMGENYVRKILKYAKSVYVPPNEYVIYFGDTVDTLYMILEGYCRLIPRLKQQPAPLKQRGFIFGFTESILGIPSLTTIQTITSCSIMIIPVADLLYNLKEFPYDKHVFDETLKQLTILKDLPQPFTICEGDILIAPESSKKKKKIFLTENFYYVPYTLHHLSKREAKYLQPYKEVYLRSFVLLRYALLRFTFYPGKPAHYAKECVRCACATLTALLYPMLGFLLNQDVAYYNYIIVLDVLAFLDIYLSLHVSYYNQKSQLVVHPLNTAAHYMKSGLLIDLAFCFPLDIFCRSRLFGYNRIGQMHRAERFLTHIQSRSSTVSCTAIIIKYLLYMLIGAHYLSGLLLDLRCNRVAYNGGPVDVEFTCAAKMWGEASSDNSAMDYYMALYIWAVSIIASSPYYHIIKPSSDGMRYILMVVVLGFFYNYYMTAQLASVFPISYFDIYKFQRKFTGMKKYLKKNYYSKLLQNNFEEYYINKWLTYKGESPESILRPFDFGIRRDILLSVYGSTILHWSIFESGNSGFARSLLSKCNVIFIPNGCHFLRPKDPNKFIYIIHCGTVQVYAGKHINVAKLTRGDIFGCFHTKQTYGRFHFYAKTNVDVLSMKTKDFRSVLESYPRMADIFAITQFFNGDYIYDSTREHGPENIHFIGSKAELRIMIFEQIKVLIAFISFLISCTCLTGLFESMHLNIALTVLETFRMIFVIVYYNPFDVDFKSERAVNTVHGLRYMRGRKQMASELVSLLPYEWLYYSMYRNNDRRFRLTTLTHSFSMIAFVYFYKRRKYNPRGNILYLRIINGILAMISFYIFSSSFFAYIFNFTDIEVLTPAARRENVVDAFILTLGRMSKSFFSRKGRVKIWSTVNFESCHRVICNVFYFMLGRELYIILTSFFIPQSSKFEWRNMLDVLKNSLTFSKATNKVIEQYACLSFNDKSVYALPELISQAPYYLKSAVLERLYSHQFGRYKMLQGLEKSFLRQVAKVGSHNIYLPQDLLARAGAKTNTMFIILSGTVEVIGVEKITENGLQHTKEILKGLLKNDQVFGLAQVFSKFSAYKWNFRARTRVETFNILREDMMVLIQGFPFVKKVLEERLQDTASGDEFNKP